jgi:hypothetical protein
MNKQEIAEILRTEVGHLGVEIQKLQSRYERLKGFVLDLESEIHGPPVESKKTILDGKFRTVIDSVFGEKPKRSKR